MKELNKLVQPLFLSVLLLAVLILLKGFLIPLLFGLLIALIVYPVCKKIENKGFSRSLAITASVLLVVLVFAFVLFILILQINALKNELPALTLHFTNILVDLHNWVESHTGISLTDQETLLKNIRNSFSNNLSGIISGSFSMAALTLFNLIIIPVYVVLFLFYRRTLVNFVSAMLGETYRKDLPAVLKETTIVYYNYIKGMLWVYLTVGVLNSIGLLILGVDYAIVFGMVSAFMTIIPYIGIIVSSVLPITMIWAETNNIWYPLGVVAVFSFVQYLEANLIFPYIVGKQLGINTFVSIVAILLGAALWGVPGMILFLPFLAIFKIISGHLEKLKPLHDLLDIPK